MLCFCHSSDDTSKILPKWHIMFFAFAIYTIYRKIFILLQDIVVKVFMSNNLIFLKSSITLDIKWHMVCQIKNRKTRPVGRERVYHHSLVFPS